VAADLGCGWHAVMDAVELYGCPLVDDPARIGTVTALGLDETLFARDGPFRTQLWSTQIVDVRGGQLLDVVAGRDHVEPCRWLAERPAEWLAGIEWATLDLSSAYRATSPTTESVHCSTPAGRTGHYSTPSAHPETRRARLSP
jgi:transposase